MTGPVTEAVAKIIDPSAFVPDGDAGGDDPDHEHPFGIGVAREERSRDRIAARKKANAAILAHLLTIRVPTAQIIEAFKRTAALLAGSDFSEDEMIAMIFTAMIDQLIASARKKPHE